MCGRYGIVKRAPEIKSYYGAQGELAFEPAYNICPTHRVPVLLEGDTGREIRLMQWSLLPSWSGTEKPKFNLINARAETVDTSAAFKVAFRRRRCILPASGFYEWKKTKAGKLPWWFTPKDDEFFSFCGLWDQWKAPDGKIIESCCMLTTEANETVSLVHDRMPCAISHNMIGAWLDPKTPSEEAKTFLAPWPASRMDARPVSAFVNKTTNQGPECLARASTSISN